MRNVKTKFLSLLMEVKSKYKNLLTMYILKKVKIKFFSLK